jgi:uncharacterized protein YndB with AHSA1/START domain
MKTSAVLMNFSVDKENKKIRVERDFEAPLGIVWAAWTESHLLDQWWAPKPWQAKTKKMDFTEGGYWLYAMIGPDGSKMWSKADYKSIIPLRTFSGKDSFCDEEGNIDDKFPTSFWTVDFLEKTGSTKLYIEITFNEFADLEKYIEMGFKEGFTAALENLDILLESAERK